MYPECSPEAAFVAFGAQLLHQGMHEARLMNSHSKHCSRDSAKFDSEDSAASRFLAAVVQDRMLVGTPITPSCLMHGSFALLDYPEATTGD